MRLGGNGSSATEGYVQAFNISSSLWGNICDNSFGIIDAHVICKMLGFPTAIAALGHSTADNLYGIPSETDFVLSNLDCAGTETSVFRCPLTGEEDEDCLASEIAGVKCATSKI